MSDVAPVARSSDGYMQHHHPTNPQLYANTTSSHHRPYHQSASTPDRIQEWKLVDESRHQGDLERPTPAPGPGSGARGSLVGGVNGGGGWGLGPSWPGVDGKGVTSKDRADDQSAKRDGLAADVVYVCGDGSKKTLEPNSESVRGDLQKVPVKQKDFLKVVDRVQRHLSDSSNSTHSSDSGVDCPCKSCKSEVKELYKENNSLRVRVKAIETISEAFEKTKKELETEKGKNAKLDIAVSNLQCRLYKFGCDSSVDLPKDDIFIPGRDRAFVNSLISENGKLLKELNELKKSGEVDEATKDLQQQLREAHEQLRISELKISKLAEEAFVRSSEDVQTAKIVHLEDACQRSHKELQDVEEMCRVLTSETKKLQAELAASQLQLESSCKELADWKEKAQNLDTKVLNVSLQKMAFHKESNLSVADQLKIAEGQVEQLEKESSRLTDQLREVIGMNTRWQRYNEQRETHVLKLTKTNQHQQSKITVLEQQKRDLEQTINGLNVMLQKLKEEQRKNTDAAILALEHQVSRREDRISEMAEELSALKMYLQSNEDATETRQRPEDRERIQILEQQLKAYKDDFQQERRDRERVQSNNEVLKHRLQDATRKIAGFEQQNARVTPNFTANIAGYQPQRRLIARGISRPSYASDEEAYRVSDLEIDAHDETDGPSSSTEPLQCPRCAQEFTVENHSIFMRHVGVCLDQ